MSLGCTRTKSTTKSRIRATELAVEATMDRAGIPSGEDGSLSVVKEKKYNVIKCDVQKYEMILKALTDRQTDLV